MRRSQANPVILAFYPLKYKDVDFLMKHKDEIEWLLGKQLPGDPAPAYKVYRERISEVKRLVSEKCIREKEGVTCVYKYRDNMSRKLLAAPVLLACRGTVIRWYENGEAVRLAFPFAKFFNYREVPMTENLPDRGGVVYEKLDGTLVSCWVDVDGEIRCSTRGMLDNMKTIKGKGKVYTVKGENPVVKAFMESIDRATLEDIVKDDTTVMFELVGDKPASQCPEVEECLSNPKPYLLARRMGDSGIEYIQHEGVPSPRKYEYTLGELLRIVEKLRDMEGFVIHYPGLKYHPGVDWWDYLVKVKSYAYVLKSEVLWEGRGKINYRSLARLVIASGTPDDIASVFPEERDFIQQVWEAWSELKEEYQSLLEGASDKAIRTLKGQGYKWLAGLLEESMTRGGDPLKHFIIRGLPRNKESILSYMSRIKRRITEAKRIVGN